jgi:radical SAM protein with 4Fe4S-binding SPASM domain
LGFDGAILDEQIFLKLMEDIGKVGVRGIQFAGCGEPLLNKALPKAIRMAYESDISVALTTNGVLYDRSLIEETLGAITWVRFSVLGCSPETYSLLHQVSPKQYDILLRNIRDAVETRNSRECEATIGVALYLFQENASEAVGFARTLRDIGIDYVQVKCPGYDTRNEYRPERGLGKIYLKELEEIETLSSESFTATVRWDQFEFGEKEQEGAPDLDLPDGCLSLDFMAAVDSDGRVYSCNGHWQDEEYCYGDLHESSFAEIWNSERKQGIVERLRRKVDHGACYSPCRNYSSNKFLWGLTHPPKHVNLI